MGSLGYNSQSRERGRARSSKTLGSRLTSATNLLSDCGPVTLLAGPSFPHNKVKGLAWLISEVCAKSKT